MDVDWKFTHGSLEFIGEYAWFNLDKGLSDEGIDLPRTLQGGYVQANYHFWFDFLNSTFLGKTFDAPTFNAVTRLGRAEIDDDGDAGTEDNILSVIRF